MKRVSAPSSASRSGVIAPRSKLAAAGSPGPTPYVGMSRGRRTWANPASGSPPPASQSSSADIVAAYRSK